MSSHFNWIYNAVTHLVKHIVMFNYVNTIYDAEIRVSIVLNIHHFFCDESMQTPIISCFEILKLRLFSVTKEIWGFFVIAKESHSFKISHDF